MGHTIQFSRFLEHARPAAPARVYLEAHGPLLPLLEHNTDPARVTVIPRAPDFPGVSGLPDTDVQIPLMSLAGLFCPSLEAIPARVPYLGTPEEWCGRWVHRLRDADPDAQGGGGLRVAGLWWAFPRWTRLSRVRGRPRATRAAGRGRGAASLAADAKEDEAGDLARAAAEALRHGRHGEHRPGERLAGVIAALEEPVVVLDDFGRIDTLNPAAAHLGLAAGADIYDHLSRPELFRAIERAREDGQMVSALLRRAQGGEVPVRVKDLGLQSGVALVFPAKAGEAQPLLSGERRLLRPNARPVHLGDEDPLLALPMVSLWVATATGRAEEGPVVAVGTVRMVGRRVFRSLSLELFVDPGAPIPAEGTAIHGVTAAMVEGARPFAAAWPVIADALRGCAVVGWGVDTALGTLARACRDAGLPEPEAPPTLDLAAPAAGPGPARGGAARGPALVHT
ncbi:hypothetical protein GAY28_35950, partial [Azospirillum brasilense]|nr:hypothetical protein [Azospirillum brasilense]